MKRLQGGNLFSGTEAGSPALLGFLWEPVQLPKPVESWQVSPGLACLFARKENARRSSRSVWWEPGWKGGALPPLICGKGGGSSTKALPYGGVIHWGGKGGESLGLCFPPSLIALGVAPSLAVSGCENPISLLSVAACNAAARVAVASFLPALT